MYIQQFLTYFINTVVLTSLIFITLDFCLLLLNCLGARSEASETSAGVDRGDFSGLT